MSADDLAPYERRLEPARERLAQGRWVVEMLDGAVDADRLERFLLRFCSLGVAMTEPVEGWIGRAGARCRALGLDALGSALEQHARHEADHHLLMITDTKALVEMRRRHGRPAPDAEALLAEPMPPGVLRYRRLHEDVIAGAAPFGQIAIEFEIERLSVVHGPRFVQRCFATLGPEIGSCLSFVADHVALDVGHTRFNATQLAKLLAERPDALEPLVAAGSAALDAYSAFLGDCMTLADREDPAPAEAHSARG